MEGWSSAASAAEKEALSGKTEVSIYQPSGQVTNQEESCTRCVPADLVAPQDHLEELD